MRRLYRFGPYEIDVERRSMTRDAAPVAITARAFDLLLVLIEERHRVVTKDELLSRVWPDQFVEEGNLTQQVFTLRRLLGAGQYIATVPRRGYQFVADVEERAAVSAAMLHTAGAVRLDVALDPPLVLGPAPALALSRDGSLLVYVGAFEESTALFARRLDAREVTLVRGTKGAASPFLAPDARWVGFAANGRLCRIAIGGGTPLVLCAVDGTGRGASWGADNVIVFAPVPAGPLCVVAAAGGTPRPLTRLAYADGERSHRFPSFAPDGRTIVFTISRAGDASFDEARLAVTTIESGTHREIGERGSCPALVTASRLYYQRGGMLFAGTFDAARGACDGVGEPLEAIATHDAGAAHAAASASGILVFAPPLPPLAPARLVWRDPAGAEEPIEGLPALPEEPRISPDGSRIVFGLRGETSDLWVYDVGRHTLARLTDTGDNFAAVWSGDGRSVIFSSNRSGASNLYRLQPESSDAPVRLTVSDCEQVPGASMSDGSVIFTQYDDRGGASVWRTLPGGGAQPVIAARWNTYSPALSPDGQWLAYTSEPTGTPEVHVTRFPALTDPRQVSRGGGSEPVWDRASRRLFFRSPTAIASVAFTGHEIGEPEAVVTANRYIRGTFTGLANYDVHPQGRLLLVAQAAVQTTRRHLNAVVPFNPSVHLH